MKTEKDILILSIKDFFTAKMIKFSLLPVIITSILIYVMFFTLAGVGLEQLGTMEIQSTQTSIQDGVPHTQSVSTHLEGSSIMQFLMSYTLTSWLASFLVYTVGGLIVLYISIFIAIIVIGFLTPYILGEIRNRHYEDTLMLGHSNILTTLFLILKSTFVMFLLFILLIPFYFIPIINIIAFNIPLYYFFHKMIIFDISSNICSKEEDRKIRFFKKNILRTKTLVLYLISLVPFTIFFGAVFYVIYLGHTYFNEVKQIRKSNI